MNLLFVLRGLPASGKSTFIKENGFEPFTIEPDQLRLLYCGLFHDVNGNLCISQARDERVWSFVNELLEERLSRGITTFLDATSIPKKTLDSYQALCKKHNTTLYIVDFTNVDVDTCKKRNAIRGFKAVPEAVINRMYENLKNTNSTLKNFNIIQPNDVNKILKDTYLSTFKIDANSYKKVIVFGDIHGCFTVLNKAMQEYTYSDENLYVFCGDYFDRGIENKEVLEFCLKNCKKKNFIFLYGNHEKHIGKFLNNQAIATTAFDKSLKQFGSLSSQLHEFYNTLKPLLIVEKNGCIYDITHAGIASAPTALTPTVEYIQGVGKYQDSEIVDASYTENSSENRYSIHGHRNIFKLPIGNTEKTYNLEGRVEMGKELRWLEISTNEKPVAKSLQNLVFDNTLVEKTHEECFIENLEKSKLIRKKDLGDGIVSYNFTRDAFFKAAWNNQTITARGLFVNSIEHTVLARAYDKFFNIEERPDTEWRNLKDKLVFPVTAYLKENGFLGIVSYNPKTDDLFVASKSTNAGEFAENFKRILLKILGNNAEKLKSILKHTNSSAIFECIDPINDPHIIEYTQEKIVLLDVVKNDFSNTFMPYSYIKDLAQTLNIEVKQLVREFNDFDKLKAFVDVIEKAKFEDTEKIEGYVFVDRNNYRLKYKTPFYKYWKNLRVLKERLASGKDIKGVLDSLQEKTIDYMKNTYTPEELTNKSIISIRNEILKK